MTIAAILIVLVAVIAGPTLWRLAKPATRTLALSFCQLGLRARSRPFQLRSGACIIFAPHQDDESLGCGGLIARKRNEGLPVQVVFITDGGASHLGHPAISAGEIASRRRREALGALAILGVESCAIHFLDEPDSTLDNLVPERQAALIDRLAALLAEVHPAEIFLPCSPDGSTEHDSAFSFICAALARASVRPEIWQYPVWSWWNPGLLFTRVLSNDGCYAQPTEDYAVIKTQALARYRSQMEPTPPWSAPVLPPRLVQNCNSPREFFFRFFLPPPGVDPARPPVI